MATPNSEGGAEALDDDGAYAALLAALRAQAAATTGPLLVTDAMGVFDVFLAGLPEPLRPLYTCATCRRFVERHGGLVTIDEHGRARGWLWRAPGIPAVYAAGVRAMAERVETARVIGAFVAADATWGVPENRAKRTGRIWQHLAVTPPASHVFTASPVKTARQRAAEIAEERGMLERALADFAYEDAVRARTLLKSGNLYRSEKADAIATWFVELHERVAKVEGDARDRLLWAAAAAAPTGFAHLRGGMLGTLLEDIQAGVAFEVLRDKWAAKMDPTQYMRPQAAPTAGNIAAAEKVVSALQSAGALARRFAQFADVQALWTPTPAPAPPPGGVFSHLAPKGARVTPPAQPAVVMTFAKFRREVLPEAVQLDVLVPAHGSFIALVTTVDPAAPPILQWDRPDRRNPVNWYVYPGGSPATQWGLAPGWVRATALTLLPSMWGGEDEQAHQGKGVIALLTGCRDEKDGGIALFPEVLKSEYRAIRATLEAYSRDAKLAGRAEASACGLDLRAGQTWNQQVRVTDRRGAQVLYTLDRWD